MDFSQELQYFKNINHYRKRDIVTTPQSIKIKISNKELINFCANDYLALANNADIKKTFKKAISIYGVGSGASHLVGGHFEIHEKLEQELAKFSGYEKVLLYSTGYMANLGVLSALKNNLDWIVQDRLNHASIIDANLLAGFAIRRYHHNDISSLEKKISNLDGQGLIVSDLVFSMDGDRVDVNKINKVAKAKNAFLMLDDAHGFGVFKNPKNIDIYMATLGKACATMGSFVAGSRDFIEYLIQKSRPYIYTTAIPPAICAATLKSLEIIKTNIQQDKLFANIDYFKKCANELGIKFMHSDSAIQPLIIGDSKKALNLSTDLFKKGFYVKAIRPPTVQKNTARLRFTLSAGHNKNHINKLFEALNALV